MKATSNDSEFDLPQIIFFKASATVVEKKQAFSLSWEVKSTTHIEIFKNGVPFLKPGAGETNVMISETYDGRDKQIEYTLTASNDFGQTQSMPVSVTVTEVIEKRENLPQIISFISSAEAVQNKELFTLTWEVKNAYKIELHRNGMVFRKYTADKTSATFSESYDGRDKDITYTIVVYNEINRVESEPLIVAIKEKVPVKREEPPEIQIATPEPVISPPDEMTPIYQMRYQENKQKNLRKIRTYLWAVLLIVFLALLMVIYYFQSKPKIFDFDPASIAEEHSIIIVGKNFPNDTTKFQVIFNKVKGSIQYNTRELIRVVVPPLEQNGDGKVAVAMVYKGDTIHASKDLVIIRTIKKRNSVIPAVTDDVSSIDSPVQEIVKKPTKIITPKKVKIDSLPVREDTQVVVRREEPKKHVDIDIYKFVKISSNDFKKGMLGGVKNLKLTIQNDSQYDLDNVTVTISYLKRNEREIKKEEIAFADVRAHASSTKDVPNTSRGSKVNFNITAISSKELDADLKH